MRHLFLTIASLLTFGGAAQLKDYTFAAPTAYTVPADLQELDAIMLFSKENLVIYPDFTSNSFVHQRIRIQNKAGLERYARFYMLKMPSQKLTLMDARIIKKSGKVQDMDYRNIKKLDFDVFDNGKSKLEELRLAIDGLEVGDDVELVYNVQMKHYLSGDKCLNRHLPCLSSEFSIKVIDPLQVIYKNYNGMPEPTLVKEKDAMTYTWKKENCMQKVGERFSSYQSSVPYLSFITGDKSFFANVSAGASFDIYLLYYIVKSGYQEDIPLNSWKVPEAQKAFADTLMGFYKNGNDALALNQTVSYINQRFATDTAADNTNTKMHEYVKKGSITFSGLVRLYVSLFNDLKIPYYIGVSRDKYRGFLDGNFIDLSQISDLFIGVKTNDNDFHLIYLSDLEMKYAMDEVPYWLEDSHAFLVTQLNNENKDFETKTLPLTPINRDLNSRTVNMKINVPADLLSESEVQGRDNFSGQFSTYFRSELEAAHNNPGAGKIYSQYFLKDENTPLKDLNVEKPEQQYPYSVKTKYSFSSKIVNKIDENLYSIDYKKLIAHFCLPALDTLSSRDLDLIPLFTYQDKYSLYLSFDSPVEIKKGASAVLQGKYASYEIKTTQINDKTIKVESVYRIREAIIPPSDFKQTVYINSLAAGTDSPPLIIGPR